ncbi:MAG: exodeoxyribonuclease [Acidobacteriota bacterium]|jgi:exodeoxyribonuclease-3|nr:exodeoxyribonuclease [Acidobacteriota bacterium]
MKIATWNVNSITARLPLVKQWLEAARPDVLCLQELKCMDEKFPAEQFAELGYKSEVFGQRTYNGVAILSRAACTDVQRGFPDDEEGAQARLIAATVEGVRVVNVYIPNGQFVGSDKYRFKLEWMQRLRRFFDKDYERSERVLLCGDFNVAPEERDVHDPAAWEGHVLFSKPERAALEKIRGWGFEDSFRLHTKEGGHYSWWDYRQGSFRRDAGMRIDHIWVSEPLARRCAESWIDKEPRTWERPSDHTPVIGAFDF